ncbi:peroxiredoxin family protein [Sulfuriflexus mobilis]|uniref:peroxiredoxin family protein n=1 Tax=Sulfuriflexus mobilis TaxID=1811807 RepID=UPI000F845729|nr:TlpA disulfide reductase family protein [Sulfuriflexus mobilis]
MPKITLAAIYTLLLASLLVFAASSQAAGLTDFTGTPRSIEDYSGKGKWLVVMFWASDCHICAREAHEYVALHDRNKDGNARVLGITIDGLANKEAAQGFVDEHKLNFPNLIGNAEDIGAMYYDMTGEFWVGTPTFFVFDPTGKLRAAQAGAVPAEVLESFIAENS